MNYKTIIIIKISNKTVKALNMRFILFVVLKYCSNISLQKLKVSKTFSLDSILRNIGSFMPS